MKSNRVYRKKKKMTQIHNMKTIINKFIQHHTSMMKITKEILKLLLEYLW